MLVASQYELAVSTAPKYIQWYVRQLSGTVSEAVSDLWDTGRPSEAAGSVYISHGLGLSFIDSTGIPVKNTVECSGPAA